MADILIGLTEKARMQQIVDDDKVRRIFTLELSDALSAGEDKRMILPYERRQSPEFWLEAVNQLYNSTGGFIDATVSIASHENPVRTPSAGSLSFIVDPETNKVYLAMAQKDASSPRDPGFRVSRNGYPRKPQDWWTMDHLIEETFEEGLLVTKDKNEIILPNNAVYDKIILDVAANLEKHTNIRFNGTTRTEMYFQPGNDCLVMTKDDGSTKITGGSISWTPETGFNIIQKLMINYPLSNLLFVDGETFPDGKPIKRDYCVIDLDNLTGKRFGESIMETVYKHLPNGEINISERKDHFYTDKVPRSLLCQTTYNGRTVYPVDWMTESREFVSSSKALRDAQVSRYSTIEKQQYEAARKI